MTESRVIQVLTRITKRYTELWNIFLSGNLWMSIEGTQRQDHKMKLAGTQLLKITLT